MIATGCQWALNSAAMYQLTGLLAEHSSRLTLLHMNASMAYVHLGINHLGGILHLHDRAALDAHQQTALEHLSGHVPAQNDQPELTEAVGTAPPDNVICFTTALQERARPPS